MNLEKNNLVQIPFNKPYITGNESIYIGEAHKRGQLAGDGHFTDLCSRWLERDAGSKKVLLTHSCTAALEMAAILINIVSGDEVIMPSFTFVSTANAFVLRGAMPVFVDIRGDTLNIDASLIEAAITKKTKAIVVVHYAGISCDMDSIMDIANRHGLFVIEDAAQGVLSKYKGKALGSIGHLGCYSFHETKNIISGEGGALLINDRRLANRAEIIREKGTNRTMFYRGEVDKYTWLDVGSSYLPGEMVAAFLWGQLQEAERITSARLKIWDFYNQAMIKWNSIGRIEIPTIPVECQQNGHIYYLLLKNLEDRQRFITKMREDGIGCVFHYVPLHSSPMGKIHGRCSGDMKVTDDRSSRLVRLPVWLNIDNKLPYIMQKISKYFFLYPD